MHQQAGAELAPYGPPELDIQVAQAFGPLELEYAAIRKSCVLMDRPDRGVLKITGPERVDFLNRMVTQELKGLAAGHAARTFWLNRKGRIDADMTLVELGDAMLVDLDALAVQRAVQGLGSFIIMEDVAIADVSEAMHRLSLHGPTAGALLDAVSTPAAGSPAPSQLAELGATRITIDGAEVVVYRDDSTGEPGLELIVPAGDVARVYRKIIEVGMDQSPGEAEGLGPKLGEEGAGVALHAARAGSRYRLRLAGWHAWNVARIEAGRAVYNIDFGPDSLPHQSGVLRERVNFKKGCYLGQEVVARMESRGHSKTYLVALKCESRIGLMVDDSLPPQALLPVTGSYIWPGDAAAGEPIGQVSSSTLAPMLGRRPICFAAVKPDFATPGTKVQVEAEGQRISAEVLGGLRAWSRDQSGR